MSRTALQIEVSTHIKGLLSKELNRHQLEKHYFRRMNIAYLSSLGMTNQEISQKVGCLEKTVRKWRRRWHQSQGAIKGFEQGLGKKGVKDKDLTDKIKEILSDMPRPGSTPRITDVEKLRLQALACEKPEDHGLPFACWTHVGLSKQANKMGIVISPAHYGRVLKKQIAPP